MSILKRMTMDSSPIEPAGMTMVRSTIAELDQLQHVVEETITEIEKLDIKICDNIKDCNEFKDDTLKEFNDQREKMTDQKIKLIEMKTSLHVHRLESENFDLKTNINIYKFISIIEAIIIAGGIIGFIA